MGGLFKGGVITLMLSSSFSPHIYTLGLCTLGLWRRRGLSKCPYSFELYMTFQAVCHMHFGTVKIRELFISILLIQCHSLFNKKRR